MTAAKDRLDVQLLTEIGIINQLSMTLLERTIPAGMSAAQFGVLSHFVRRGREESPAQLASAFQVTKGAMTNTLQRLEAQGLLASAWSTDHAPPRRYYQLSPQGLAALEALSKGWRDQVRVMDRLLDGEAP
jgi:DNA-binding PadR family transcriptional regulator